MCQGSDNKISGNAIGPKVGCGHNSGMVVLLVGLHSHCSCRHPPGLTTQMLGVAAATPNMDAAVRVRVSTLASTK
jgi:hypothetical protein